MLVVVAKQYVKLSASVMIGLPAIALALVAVWLMTDDYRRLNQADRVSLSSSSSRGRGWRRVGIALVSGAVFGVSTQVKMFTFILLPMLAVCWWQSDRRDRWPRLGAWVVGLMVTLLLIFPWRADGWRQQLVAPHVARSTTDLTDNLRALAGRLAEDAPLTFAAVLSLALGGRAVARQSLPAIAWLVSACAALANAQQVWPHHRVMLSLPLAMIAGIGLAHVARLGDTAGDDEVARTRGTSRPNRPAMMLGVAVVLAIGFGALRTIGRVRDDVRENRVEASSKRFDAIFAERGRVRWAVTDDPLPVYVAGMRTPPEIAVLSSKRTWQGEAPEALVGGAIEAYHPELIYLSRYRYSDAFHAGLLRDYDVRFAERRAYVYVLKRAGWAAVNTTTPSGTRPSGSERSARLEQVADLHQ